MRRVKKSRMCPSNTEELHRSFKPLLYMVKISGLLPNEIREVDGNLVTARSILGVIQTITYIILYSGMVYFMRRNDIIVMKLDGVSMVIENIQLFAFELIYYVLVLSAIIRLNDFLQILRCISRLDSLLLKIGEEMDYRKEFRRNMILVGLICTMYGSLAVLHYLTTYQPGFEYIFHTLIWFTPSFSMHLVLLQFSIMVFSLKLRCAKLNNAVSRINDFTNVQNSNVVPNIEIHTQSLEDTIYYSYNTVDTIWNLSVIYDIICNICQTINKVFAFQTTFGLVVTSFFLTFRIYDLATYIKDTTLSYTWGQLLINGQTLLLHVSTIFGITYCCHGVKSEVDQVAILLHKVKPRRVEHREAINTFSLQLMHQKVQFTACGLFNIDYTFIYLLISTITTYMVILVQFGQTIGSQSSKTKIDQFRSTHQAAT